jgi:HNH endonuclease
MKYPTGEELRRGVPGLNNVRPPVDRLTRRYVVEPNGCWRWTGGVTGSGYGHFSIRSIYYQAHRLLYILHRGAIPDGFEPDHLCRNRRCVNPWHLELVTRSVNVQRGTGTRLRLDQVAAIRAARVDGVGVRELGRRYGVNHATVSRIVNERTWKPEATGADSEAVA